MVLRLNTYLFRLVKIIPVVKTQKIIAVSIRLFLRAKFC